MSKILVLEDDAKLSEVLRETLEAAGHEVTEAPDGDVGLKQFKLAPADLVIADIFMPEKDGLEVIRELKSDFPDVKIIAISGGGGFETLMMVLAMAAGFVVLAALLLPARIGGEAVPVPVPTA